MTQAEMFNVWADAHYPNRNRHDTGRMYAAWQAALANDKPKAESKKTRAKSGKSGAVGETD